jgi:hypothetical protein
MGNRCYKGPQVLGQYSAGICSENESLLSPPLTVTDNHLIRSTILFLFVLALQKIKRIFVK